MLEQGLNNIRVNRFLEPTSRAPPSSWSGHRATVASKWLKVTWMTTTNSTRGTKPPSTSLNAYQLH
ncbi:hypothetical protein LguiA_012818 [Lonicera macranthoides]